MSKETVLIAPRKYVQGRNVIQRIGEFLTPITKHPIILWDAQVKGIVGESVIAGLQAASIEFTEINFTGDSTKPEAARVAELAKEAGADAIVGIGGGKTLDTAKAAAHQTGLAMVTVPTIASNDSPTSSYTVWYDDEGNCLGFESWGRNPDLVLVDSQVIAGAPVHTFVAGMGDALATWFEADSCYKARGDNLAGGLSTQAAMALARLGFDILLEHGVDAKRAVEANVVTPAVEKVIEANVLLSGLGFESCGIATAHMIANCIPSFPECHHLTHGDEVAFGVISQICLDEDMDADEMYAIVDFLIDIGLPVTFADLGLEDVTRDRLQFIGDICGGEGSYCVNHPFEVTADDIIDAMIAADALGRDRKGIWL